MADPDDPNRTWAVPGVNDPAAPAWQQPPVDTASSPTGPVIAAPPVATPQEVGAPQLDGAVPPPPDGVSPPQLPADALASPLPLPGQAPPLPLGSDASGQPLFPAAPDALSAAAPIIPEATIAGLPGFDIRPETHADQFTGHPWDNPDQGERDQAARNFALNDPAGFAAYQQHLSEAKQAHAAALSAKTEQDNLTALKQDIADRQRADAITQAKSDQIVADATKLASQPLDRHRWFANKSTFQKIATVGVALIGGLLQGANGGRNTGMDWVTKSIDEDIDDQKADIENKRAGITARQGAVAQEYARTGNLYQAAETVRLASYQSAINQLLTEQQNYDSRGTSFAAIGKGAQQLVGGQQQVQQAMQKELHTQALADIKEVREQAAAVEAQRHNRAQESIEWAKEATAKKSAGQVYTPEQLAALQPAGSPIPKIAMNQKDYGEWLGNIKKGQEAALGGREYTVGGVAKAVHDADGNVVDTTYTPLTNKNGEEFRAPTTAEAEKLRTQKAGVDVANQLIGDMADGIKESGGASEFFKSPRWQQIQANKESLLFALHNAYGVEGFRPGVLEQMEHALGGQNPAKLSLLEHDAVPGLQEARKDLNKHFDAKLRAAGYTGDVYSPELESKGEPLPKLSDRTYKENEPGLLDKQPALLKLDADALLHPLDRNPDVGTEADPRPAAGETGLSPKDTSTVLELAKRYDKGTPATRAKVVTAIVSSFGAGRESLNNGVIELLRDSNPELYAAAVKALPPGQRKQEEESRDIEARRRSSAPPLPVDATGQPRIP